MKKLTLISFAAAAIAAAACGSDKTTPAIPTDKALEAKVQKTLKGLSLEEKAGQMIQLTIDPLLNGSMNALDPDKMDVIFGQYKIGSVLNVLESKAQTREKTAEIINDIQKASAKHLSVPMLYGLDMIHGASYLTDATFFPQEINIAASFDRAHAVAMGSITAYESRAGACPWVFSPVMDLGRDPRWPRIWESFGEDAYLQSEMAVAETIAMQGDDPNNIDSHHTAVSLKHFMAYGIPVTGKDRTPAIATENELREKFFRPFKECVEAGALTIMVNSASINGVPTHANKTLLTDWLKDGLNWDGMIVSDWADINNLYTRERIAPDRKHALALAVNAGVDMVMEPYDPGACDDLIAAVNEGLIPMSRLDDAVSRIIRLKYRLGLFDNPILTEEYPDFGCSEFVDAARRAALESEVLLKNDGVLPIRKGARILVTGPNSNSIRTLNGGWSYTWQGTDDPAFVERFNTIYEALADKFGASNVKWVPGLRYSQEYSKWEDELDVNIQAAVAAARNADVIVACVGENSYCETPGNLTDLNLSANQKALVKALADTGKPIVLVLNEGRPRIIGDIEPLASAVVDVMLPGNYGGDALAELLAGDANFCAKLPFTYPKHINSLHTYDYKVSELVSTMVGAYNYDAVMDVQWNFGHGLSYTSFAYSDFKCSADKFRSGEELHFEVTVSNTGDKAGKEAVLLYSSDLVASLVPDARRLRAFTKVELQPGESQTVCLSVPADELAFVGEDGEWHLEPGEFRFSAGGQSLMLECL